MVSSGVEGNHSASSFSSVQARHTSSRRAFRVQVMVNSGSDVGMFIILLCGHGFEVFFQCVEALVPLAAVLLDPGRYLNERLGTHRQGPPLGVCCAFNPARSSTLRCWEIAGALISKSSATSPTVAALCDSLVRMFRRDG